MDANAVLRQLRYALQLSDREVADLCALAGPPPTREQVRAWTRREGEPGWAACPPRRLGHFLDGLVRDRRGPPPPGAPVAHGPVTNNEVLKKLRIAFTLREGDLLGMLRAGGQRMSKAELGGLMRRPDHPNFRPCGDQALRKFLQGFTRHVRRGTPDAASDARRRPERRDDSRQRTGRDAGGGARVRRPTARRRLVHDSADPDPASE